MLLKSAQKAGCGGPDVLKNDIICLRRCYAEEEAGVQDPAHKRLLLDTLQLSK